ncbi:hypothetical protein, partial [Agaribacter flavus]
MCVFFTLCACSKPSSEADIHKTSQTPPTPLLSLSELLSADDVRDSLMQASKLKDTEALKIWQSRLLSAADEVNLLPSERRLIEGPQGLIFLEFQGMKFNYQLDFDKAFFNFDDVNSVFKQYPAFESLHEQGRVLISKRDALIAKSAEELKKKGFKGDALSEAKLQWQ